MTNKLSRRDFLKYTGMSSAAAFAAAYGMPLGTALAQAPPGDTAGHLVIYNFGGAEQQQMIANAIGRFNERYPNVVVEDLYIPWPEGWGHYTTNLKLRVASGLKTDIIAIAIEGTRETIFEDLVLPMDDAIAADDELQAIVDEVEPVLHDALKGPDGQTYYFTREWNNMIIHYNTAIFEEAGLDPPAVDWTWEDFLETASVLTHGEGADKQFGFAIPYFNFGLTPWWHTNDTATLTADWSQSNLDDPKMLESVKFVHSLVHEHGVAPSVEGLTMTEHFMAGTAAMTGAGRWPFDTYVSTDWRTVDITPWPRNRAGTTVFGSGGWAVSKTAENVPLALELIKNLTAFETDMEAVAVGTSLPARRSATENELFNSFPANAHRFFGSLEDIKPVPSPENFSEYEAIFMRHMDQIMANSLTPEQGLEMAHVELTAAMDKLAERMAES
ncbi:MAG: extracellular solute-binding protein [Chloroflexi bacterium]|nr:extracellular solute-binding protein [Chloroflexota bacterium]